MISVRIGEESRDGIDPSWINDQLNRRLRDRLPVCVEVRVSELNLRLATPECGMRGGGGGELNRRQQEIAKMWDDMVLKVTTLNGGHLVAFLKQLSKKGL